MPKIYRRKLDGAEVVVAKVHLGNAAKVADWLFRRQATLDIGGRSFEVPPDDWLVVFSDAAKGKPYLFIVDPLSERREFHPQSCDAPPDDIYRKYELVGEYENAAAPRAIS